MLQIFDMRITFGNYRFVRLKQKISTRQEKNIKISKPSLNRKEKSKFESKHRWICVLYTPKSFCLSFSTTIEILCYKKTRGIRRKTRKWLQSKLTQMNIPTPWKAVGTKEDVSQHVLAVVGAGAWRVNAVNVSDRIKPRKKYIYTNLSGRNTSSDCHVRTRCFLRKKR